MAAITKNIERVTEACSLLLLFSFFALVEGIVRMTANSRPFDEVSFFTANGNQMPIVVFLTAGVAEVAIGMGGIFVAVFTLFFEKGSPALTQIFAVVQLVLGWFVFLVYAIVSPIKEAATTQGIPSMFTPRQHGTLIVLGGLVGSVTFSWALFGGQYIMAKKLLAAQKDEEETKSQNGARAVFWAINVIVASISTVCVGFVLFLKSFNSTTIPIVAMPHAVWFPSVTLITGAIMLAYGIMGLMATNNKGLATGKLPIMWAITTLAMMINFSWIFGLVPGLTTPMPGATQQAGLVLSVTFLPAYHAWRTHKLVVSGKSLRVKRARPQEAAESAPSLDKPSWGSSGDAERAPDLEQPAAQSDEPSESQIGDDTLGDLPMLGSSTAFDTLRDGSLISRSSGMP